VRLVIKKKIEDTFVIIYYSTIKIIIVSFGGLTLLLVDY